MTTCSRCDTTWGGARIEHCTSCHQTFTGTTAGDKHRTGDHAVSVGPNRRRCLTAQEMEARGMVRNGKGHWMTRADTRQNALPQRPEIDAQDVSGWLVHPVFLEPYTQYGSGVQ